VIAAVNRDLEDFLSPQLERLAGIHPDLAMLGQAARAAVLNGGKRLRPTFAYWGWRTGQPAANPAEPDLIRAVASLELLHAGALVHDDLMDASDTRRGQPAAHVRFGAEHRDRGWPGPGEAFGQAGAVLLGDLLLCWAGEMFTQAIRTLPPERAVSATAEFDAMSTEVVAGQFLDAVAQAREAVDPAEALRVIEYKTSKYTVQRPLLLGAGAAGAGPQTAAALAAYGLALGEAFQLRDDLLGVFGNPAETGKPAGDDLREGKRTLLVALAVQSADARQAGLLEQGLGRGELSDEQVQALRQVLVDTGARHAVEVRIAERAIAAEQALTALDPDGDARAALVELAQAAAHRRS
jgi:geranylgeranyl diphosphate synthase type I